MYDGVPSEGIRWLSARSEAVRRSSSAAASTRAREAYFLEYARTVRGLVGDIPLAVTGGFRSRAAMNLPDLLLTKSENARNRVVLFLN